MHTPISTSTYIYVFLLCVYLHVHIYICYVYSKQVSKQARRHACMHDMHAWMYIYTDGKKAR